jgi:hypothetical protein
MHPIPRPTPNHNRWPAGGCWGLLGSARGCWGLRGLLEAAGSCWGLLGAAWGCWGLLGAAGGCWGLLGAAGRCWGLLETAGGCWGHFLRNMLLRCSNPTNSMIVPYFRTYVSTYVLSCVLPATHFVHDPMHSSSSHMYSSLQPTSAQDFAVEQLRFRSSSSQRDRLICLVQKQRWATRR